LFFKPGQIGGRHLPAFAGDVEQAVLVNLPRDPFGHI
jgi:hypothetical protein